MAQLGKRILMADLLYLLGGTFGQLILMAYYTGDLFAYCSSRQLVFYNTGLQTQSYIERFVIPALYVQV